MSNSAGPDPPPLLPLIMGAWAASGNCTVESFYRGKLEAAHSSTGQANPDNGREIMADDKLQEVFGRRLGRWLGWLCCGAPECPPEPAATEEKTGRYQAGASPAPKTELAGPVTRRHMGGRGIGGECRSGRLCGSFFGALCKLASVLIRLVDVAYDRLQLRCVVLHPERSGICRCRAKAGQAVM